jgi:hypothetical protein
MQNLPANNKPTDRRQFIGDTFKLAILGSIFGTVEQSCNNKRKENTLPEAPAKPGVKKIQPGKKTVRKKWSYEKLVVNSKSKVIHFPSSKIYTYYDEISPKHLQDISMAAWTTQLHDEVTLNKEQSGNILEILTMQNFSSGINGSSLNAGIDTLSKAFSKDCMNSKNINSNTTNFRLHELMLQLVTLNESIPETAKWQTFNEKIKKPPLLRKRQKWMETETSFNERVRYILDRKNDYIARLLKRSSKYSIT